MAAEQLVDSRVVIVRAQLACLVNNFIIDVLMHLKFDDGGLELVKLLLADADRRLPLPIGVWLLDADVGTDPATTALIGVIRPIARRADAQHLLKPIHLLFYNN